MPFTRPTLTELIDRVTADIGSRMVGVDSAVLRRSLLGIIGRSEAGAVHMLYGYLDWIARQVMPDTAEAEYLERWAAIWKVSRKQASFASGPVTFTAVVGSVIPAGTIVQRQDGQQYEILTEAAFVTSSIQVDARAIEPGAEGNLAAGTALFLLTPVAGVQSSAAVAAGGISGGADVEADQQLLARLLSRIQQPPQGGAENDYKTWALEVGGVTRAWVFPLQMGPGTVTVLFVCDDSESIIPDGAKVAEVQDHIDMVRPVTAEVFVAAPVASPLDMTIKLKPNTPAVRSAVLAELDDLLIRDAEPGATILISRLREAVSLAAGEADNQITVPAADVIQAPGNMAVLGTVTFLTL